jgi:uncharacterized membrane protein (UPF0127 family)
MAWLVRDGDVLASAEVADTARARRRGLAGRDAVEGALVLRPCRHVHTFGMRFPLDVALCDRNGVVLRVMTLRQWRMAPLVPGVRMVVEAASGSLDRWHVHVGDMLEVRQ